MPRRLVAHTIAMTAPKAPAVAVLAATTAKRGSVAAKVEAALNPNQPNSRMNVPSIAIGLVTRQRAGRPVGGELADAGADHDRTGERRHPAHGVHDTRAREVDVALAEAERVAQL